MKLFYILILCASCARAQTTGVLGSSPFLNPVIVMIGESNAGGIALNSSLTTAEYSNRPATKIFNNNNKTFETLRIGVNNLLSHQGLSDTVTHGMENGIANCVDSGTLGVSPIYILKSGEGGTQIAWWNDSTYTGYFSTNPWQQFKSRMDSALIILTALSGNTRPPIYIIWSLGINDAIAGVSAATFKADTKTFFTKLRARYGSVPIFITYLPASYTTYNTSIGQIATEVSNCYAIQTSDAGLQDANHWNYAGMKIIATRIIYTLINNYRFRY